MFDLFAAVTFIETLRRNPYRPRRPAPTYRVFQEDQSEEASKTDDHRCESNPTREERRKNPEDFNRILCRGFGDPNMKRGPFEKFMKEHRERRRREERTQTSGEKE